MILLCPGARAHTRPHSRPNRQREGEALSILAELARIFLFRELDMVRGDQPTCRFFALHNSNKRLIPLSRELFASHIR